VGSGGAVIGITAVARLLIGMREQETGAGYYDILAELGHGYTGYSPRGNNRGAVSGKESRRVSVRIIAHELVIAGEHVG
jgi:hypothetical protein